MDEPGKWIDGWRRSGNCLIHISGAVFIVTRGNGFTDINAAPETLEDFQNYELASGISLSDLTIKFRSLANEAVVWDRENPD